MNKKISFLLIFLVTAAICLVGQADAAVFKDNFDIYGDTVGLGVGPLTDAYWSLRGDKNRFAVVNPTGTAGTIKFMTPNNESPGGNWWKVTLHQGESYQRVSVEFNTGSLAGQGGNSYLGTLALSLNQDRENSGYWCSNNGYVLNIRGVKDMWLSRNGTDVWVWGGAYPGNSYYDAFDSDLQANTTYRATLIKDGNNFTGIVATLNGTILAEVTYAETIPALTGGEAGIIGRWGPDYELDNFIYELRGDVLAVPYGTATIDANLADWADAEWVSDELAYGYYTGTNYGSEDVNTANTKFAFKWSPNVTPDVPGYVYAAVVVDDANHQLRDNFMAWYASDRVEFYVHGNPADWTVLNGEYWQYQDLAQQYIVGIKNSNPNQSWMVIGNGLGTPADVELDATSAVKVVGNQLIYEVKIPVYDNWDYVTTGIVVPTEMKAGIEIGFDLAVDTRNVAYAGGGASVEEQLIAMLDRTAIASSIKNKAMGAASNMLTILLSPPPCNLQYDLDGDCFIDFNDLDVLVSEWLTDGLSGFTDNFDSYGNTVELGVGPLTDQNWSLRGDKNQFAVVNPTGTAGTVKLEAPGNPYDAPHGNWWKPNVQTIENYQSVSVEFNTGSLSGQPSPYSGGLRLALNQDVANSGYWLNENGYILNIRGIKDMWISRTTAVNGWGTPDGTSYHGTFTSELQANTTYRATFIKDGNDFTATVTTLGGTVLAQATYTETIAALTGGQAGISAVWGPDYELDNFEYILLANGCTLVHDLNGDCFIDLNDFAMLASEWMQSGY